MPWPWRRRRTEPTRVVMYTRHGCHLCEEAWRLLEEVQGRYALELEAVDVDGDPELVRLHGERVPVVLVNGQERFRGGLNRALLERLLRAEG